MATLREMVASPTLALVYDKAYEAAECETASFYLDVATVQALVLPHLSQMRQLARLLAARAWLRAEQGDGAGALADIRVGLRLGRLLEQDPFLISQLVRIADEVIAARALQPLLDQARAEALPAAAVAGVVQELQAARVANRAAIVRSMEGEMVLFGGPFFEEWLGRRPPKLTVDFSPSGVGDLLTSRGMRLYVSYPLRPLLKLDYCTYLDIVADCRHNLGKPYWDVAPPSRSWPFGHQVPRWCNLTRVLAPALGHVFPKAAHIEAELLLGEVALALDLYRHTKGQYPADLRELGLVPAPVDPFTGKDLPYRRTESGGAVVYSVGRNGVDDGGKAFDPQPGSPLDIVWELKPQP